jgi:hypothetical protein
MTDCVSRLRILAFAASLLALFAPSRSATAATPGARARTSAITISIGDIKVTEDDVDVSFTVTLSGPSPTPVSVHYQTHDGTATVADEDYVAAGGTLTIPANTVTGTITVSVVGDAVFEGDETFRVDLSSPVGVAIADGQGVGTISNNDLLPQISVANVQVAEGDSGATPAVFAAVLSNPSSTPVSFDYQTANGTATIADGDYSLASGTVTFPAKAQLATFTVHVNGDRVYELADFFSVQLSYANGATLSNATATGTISNDDATPRFQIDDIAVIEGNSGVTPAVFTVRLTNPTYQTVTVHYRTTNGGTALSFEQDFVDISGDLAIPPKATSATVTVPVKGDIIVEDDEWFPVVFENAVNASLPNPLIVHCTITNDDGPPYLTIGSLKVAEGNSGVTPAVLTVHRTGTTPSTVTVDWHTTDGTALAADGDYQPASGTLAIPPNQSSGTITVLVNGDLNPETDETFTVDLSNAPNATIQTPSGSVTISDDEPFLTIGSLKVAEGNSGVTPAVLTVQRTGTTPSTVTVDWHTTDGSALAVDGDYQPASGTLTIPPNQNSASITVLVNGDVNPELDENFTVDLTNAHNATIQTPGGSVTISDDDGSPPRLSINDVKVMEGSNSNYPPAVLTVYRHGVANSTTVSVDWHTSDGSAVSGDYGATSGTVTIPPNKNSATITVNIVSDQHYEPDEFFTVTLSNPVNASILNGTGTVTISNDDPFPNVTIAPVSVVEGNSGTRSLVFKVGLDPGPFFESTFMAFHTADSTATVADQDYVPRSGVLTFTYGYPNPQTVMVTVNGDTRFEPDEAMLLDVDLIYGYGWSVSTLVSGVGTIVDDDLGPQVQVLTPGFGEVIDTGVPYQVSWMATDQGSKSIIGVDLLVSIDNGAHYIVLATNRPNTGTYMWTPPDSVHTNTPEDPTREQLSALFKVVAHDGDGKSGSGVSEPFAISNQALVSVPGGTPVAFGLGRVGPIPSAGPLRISYTLPREADVRLAIVDVQGRTKAVLAEGSRTAGMHEAVWNHGSDVLPGIYFVSYRVAGRSYTRRVVVTQ